MSAARAPHDPQQEHSPASGAPVERRASAHLRVPGKGAFKGGTSPARQLQSELAESLNRPERISFRSTLATLLVLCLAMSIATLSLLTTP